MKYMPFRTLAACAISTTLGTASASMGEVVMSSWTDSEHFYYYVNHMPDFDQVRCEDMEPSVEGLPEDGINYCVPTATTNVFSYIASHGFPHIDPGVVFNPESDYFYDKFGEFIEDLGVDMDTDPLGGTNYDDYYEEIKDRLSCEFVVKLYIAKDDYAPSFKGLCRSAINGHLILVRNGYYDDLGTTESGRYKVDRYGGHLTTFRQGWGYEGTEIMTVRDPATGGSDCYGQSEFSSRSWHIEERRIQDEYGDNRTQCYMYELDGSVYGSSKRYLDGYISIIPNRFYSWGPYDNGIGIKVFGPIDSLFTNVVSGPVMLGDAYQNWTVGDFKPHPSGMGGWALMKSPKGLTSMAEIDLDTNTLTPVELANIAPNPKRFVIDSNARLWVADDAPGQNPRLQIFDKDPSNNMRPLASLDLQSPPAAMTLDGNDMCAFFPSEGGFRWFSRSEGNGYGSTRFAPLPQQIQFQGECSIEIDPKTGDLLFWSEGFADRIWSLSMGDEGVFEVSEIRGEKDQPIDSFQFDDHGNLLMIVGGTMCSVSRNDQGQWVPLEDHLFNGVSVNGGESCVTGSCLRFSMLRSSNNLPTELSDDQYDNAGLEHESQFGDYEQLDCNADINRDRMVDVNDLLIVISEWGNVKEIADIEYDGIVDVKDLLAVIESWGMCR